MFLVSPAIFSLLVLRIQALLCVYILALMAEALVERELREAMAVLDDLRKGWRSENTGALNIASIHAGLGEKQEALTWLERVYVKQPGQLTTLNIDPAWDSLREEPRFKALLKKINLER